MDKYPEMTPFALAFAAAYRGFMKECKVTGVALAARLDRNNGYVSERVNGKRPLDTLDVDALAELAGPEWTGKLLMVELARRSRVAGEAPTVPGNVIVGGFGQTAEPTSYDMIDDAGVVEMPERYAADEAPHAVDHPHTE